MNKLRITAGIGVSGLAFVIIFVMMNPAFAESNIPTWVKNNAG